MNINTQKQNTTSKFNDKSNSNKKTEAYEVASQWKLMRWKFKKHKLARIAAPVLVILYLLAIFCEFLSPTVPLKRYTDYKNAPPSKIHFVDPDKGFSFRPFVYDIKQEVNPETFRRTFVTDKSKKIPLYFFIKGEPYKFWGLFKTDRHFIGPKGKDQPFFFMGTD